MSVRKHQLTRSIKKWELLKIQILPMQFINVNCLNDSSYNINNSKLTFSSSCFMKKNRLNGLGFVTIWPVKVIDETVKQDHANLIIGNQICKSFIVIELNFMNQYLLLSPSVASLAVGLGMPSTRRISEFATWSAGLSCLKSRRTCTPPFVITKVPPVWSPSPWRLLSSLSILF